MIACFYMVDNPDFKNVYEHMLDCFLVANMYIDVNYYFSCWLYPSNFWCVSLYPNDLATKACIADSNIISYFWWVISHLISVLMVWYIYMYGKPIPYTFHCPNLSIEYIESCSRIGHPHEYLHFLFFQAFCTW